MLGATLGTRDMGMGEKDRKQTNKKQTLRSESLLSVGETGHKNMKNISSITWWYVLWGKIKWWKGIGCSWQKVEVAIIKKKVGKIQLKWRHLSQTWRYLMLTNYHSLKLLSNNIYFESHSFYVSGGWAWLSWTLRFRVSYKSLIKMSNGVGCLTQKLSWGRICFKVHMVVVRISVPFGNWTEGLNSFLITPISLSRGSLWHRLLSLFSWSILFDTLWPHGLQHTRLHCPSLSSRVCSNSCPLSQWSHIQPSHALLPPSPALSLCQHQGLFQWVSSSYQMGKLLELQRQSSRGNFCHQSQPGKVSATKAEITALCNLITELTSLGLWQIPLTVSG